MDTSHPSHTQNRSLSDLWIGDVERLSAAEVAQSCPIVARSVSRVSFAIREATRETAPMAAR